MDRPGRPRHRTAPSIGTNASGIAESTISVNTVATEESLHLSSFPAPPAEIPTPMGTPSCTPTRSTFHASAVMAGLPPLRSPTRSLMSPSSPIRSHHRAFTPTRSPFTPSPPATPGWAALSSRSSSPQSLSTQLPSEKRTPRSPGRDSAANPPPSQSTPLPSSLNQVQKSPKAERSTRPLPAPPGITTDPRPSDWPADSTQLSVDVVEDSLLPTAFITGLLDEYPGSIQSSRPPTERDASIISAVTYPPQEPPPPLPLQVSYAHIVPLRPWRRNQNTRPPPSSYVEVPNPTPRSKRLSADSSILYSLSSQQPGTTVRSASIAKAGPKGTSIVGYAPATLRRVSRSSSWHGSKSSLSPLDKLAADPLKSANDLVEGEKTPFAPALPSSMGHDSINGIDRVLLHRRNSAQSINARSVRSFVSSFFARSHRQAGEHVASWFRTKPLPPVPRLPNMPTPVEIQRRTREMSMTLPELMQCASDRHGLLDKDVHSHISVDGRSTAASWRTRDLHPLRSQTFPDPDPPDSPKIRPRGKFSRVRICFAFGLLCLVLCGIIVGVLLGLRKQERRQVCHGNWTGNACNLDATCVCTSSLNGQCNALAQGLVSLMPTLNSYFQTNYTSRSLASAIWQVYGAPVGNDCASQVQLVDVAPALDSDHFPNRTSWAQAALLWNLVKSQDQTMVATLREFVLNAPWKQLQQDGPVTSTSTGFNVSTSGYIFDFAAQTISPPRTSFIADGQPTTDQIARVGDKVRPALDRMHSYALASSTQQQLAMGNYWSSVLQQKQEDLSLFISSVSSAPILVPFDTTATAGTSPIASLLTDSRTAPFPPPMACYPGLNARQIGRLNAIETSVFGLSSTSAASSFDAACFPDRPLYGILDITRLRLPFLESCNSTPQQAAVLSHEVAPRVVVFPGTLGLTNLTSNNAPSIPTMAETDPRRFGTLHHLNHVMLTYLSSIPDVNTAIALVQYVLSSPTVPPANSTTLFNKLNTLPPLEVAVFGSIIPPDVSAAVSSYTTPSGSLFFGSDGSLSLRRWAINAAGGSVVWTESATSPLVVRDTSLTDSSFQRVWDPVFRFLHSSPSGAKVGVSNITASFQNLGKFSP